jgi:hypothetical protein
MRIRIRDENIIWDENRPGIGNKHLESATLITVYSRSIVEVFGLHGFGFVKEEFRLF